MLTTDLIQLLMKDENIEKEIQIRDKRTGSLYDLESVNDISSILELQIFSDEDECDRPHVASGDCACDCDACEECYNL